MRRLEGEGRTVVHEAANGVEFAQSKKLRDVVLGEEATCFDQGKDKVEVDGHVGFVKLGEVLYMMRMRVDQDEDDEDEDRTMTRMKMKVTMRRMRIMRMMMRMSRRRRMGSRLRMKMRLRMGMKMRLRYLLERLSDARALEILCARDHPSEELCRFDGIAQGEVLLERIEADRNRRLARAKGEFESPLNQINRAQVSSSVEHLIGSKSQGPTADDAVRIRMRMRMRLKLRLSLRPRIMGN